MTGIAITFLILSIVVVWGGLVASIVYLSIRPGLAAYPAGGEDMVAEEPGPIQRDL